MKTKLSTKLLSMLLCLLMCVSLIPAVAFAEDAGSEDFGEAVEEAEPEKNIPDDETAGQIIDEETPDADAEAAERSGADEQAQSEETVCNEAATSVTGECGDKLTWTLDTSTGLLIISGTGAMDNYWSTSDNAPWYSYAEYVNVVEIESGVTSIGSFAFYGCDDSLISVDIPSTVTSIGRSAFVYCRNLMSADLPEGLRSISLYAFSGCSSLTSMTIPSTVSYIAGGLFSGCTGLAYIDVKNTNEYYCSVDGVVYDRSMQTLVQYPVGSMNTVYSIPDGVTKIEVGAFDGAASLESIYIPSSVTRICGDAFQNCTGLVYVDIPERVTGIEYGAFQGCSSLTAITIPEGVTVIDDQVFLGCSSLGSVTIPSSVTSINRSAFLGCSSLTGVIIPDSVESLGNFAFYNCESLTEIKIPASVTSLGMDVFHGCSSLTSITFAGSAPTFEEDVFYDDTLTAYYPEDDDTWTDDVMQQYGGEVTWVAYTPLRITTQPADVCGMVGSTARFTVGAKGKSLTWQWQYSKDSGQTWSNSPATGSTTNTLSVSVTASRNGYLYRCVVTDIDGTQVISDSARLTVKSVITGQPADVSDLIGASVTFKVTATGVGLKYQWQYSKDSGANWNNSPATGANTDTLSTVIAANRNGYLYRCIITDANGEQIISNAAEMTVKAAIATQPVNRAGKVGSTVKFTLTATGAGLKYQWQVSTNSGKTWSDSPAAGNTTNTLTVDVLAYRNGYRYRCVITDANGAALTSKAVKLIVKPAITSQPSNVTAAAGSTAGFTVKATGAGLKYQWQYSTDNGTTWKNSPATGSTTNTLTVDALKYRSGYLYRCVITDANSSTLTSKAAKLTVS